MMRVVALLSVMVTIVACRDGRTSDVDELVRQAQEGLELLAKLDPARSKQYREGIRTVGRAGAVVRSIDFAKKMRPRIRAYARTLALVRRHHLGKTVDDERWDRESHRGMAILRALDRAIRAKPAQRDKLERKAAAKLVELIGKPR